VLEVLADCGCFDTSPTDEKVLIPQAEQLGRTLRAHKIGI
jgi:hypothetical protein